MTKRTSQGLDELILLAEKMPRDQLVKVIPPEKLLKLVHNYLYSDPCEDQLRLQHFEQSQLVNEIENERKEEGEDYNTIADIKAKLQREFRKMVDARSKKKTDVSMEEQAAIRLRVELKVWKVADVDKLKFLERERDALFYLEGKYADYLRSTDSVRTKLAGDIANEGIAYCSTQISKVLAPVLSNKVKDSLDDASELLTFIPGMVGSRK